MNGNWASDELVRDHADQLRALKNLGLGRRRIAKQIHKDTGRPCTDGVVYNALGRLGLAPPRCAKPIEITEKNPPAPSDIPIEELIASRIKASERKSNKSQQHKRMLEFPVEPFGIIVHGDPHLDDDGCALDKLVETVTLAQQTEGIVQACVGDNLNLWVGRLQAKYADASILASDGWRLSEWFLSSGPFLAICSGNHDQWGNTHGLDPLGDLAKRCGVRVYAPDEIRITFTWKNRPDLEPIIWILRHDFKGRSFYHATHGVNKEAMLDGKAHILTAGHIHQWGELTTEQRHGRITTSIRVRGYKFNDDYAMRLNLSEQQYGEAALIVIDPLGEGPARVKTFWDIKQGCEFLTLLRSK